VLSDVAERAGKSMVKAADKLADHAIHDAVTAQADALDALNDIYMTIAPFMHLLKKATAGQQRLVDQSSDAVERAGENTAPDEEERPVDFQELARSQIVVNGWTKVLPLKAEQEKKRLASQPADAPVASADPQQAQQLAEGLSASLDKAIELGPEIERLTAAAAEQLERSDAKAALPDQQQALTLLEQIAETLPKEQQKQNGDPQTGNEGQKQQDPNQNQANEQRQQDSPPQQDLSRQQAEALLRKVRERERDYHERQKQLRGYVRGGVKVDQDW
jgi:hypothetical protein